MRLRPGRAPENAGGVRGGRELPLMPETISETVDNQRHMAGLHSGNPFCEILEGYYGQGGSSYKSDLSDINRRIAAIRNASEAEFDEANEAPSPPAGYSKAGSERREKLSSQRPRPGSKNVFGEPVALLSMG